MGANLLTDFLTLFHTLVAGSGHRGNKTYLFGADGLLARLGQLVCNLLVVAKILLATDKNDGETLAEVKDLGDPLCKGAAVSKAARLCRCRWRWGVAAACQGLWMPYLFLDVVKRVGGVDGEANQDDVGVGVGEGAEAVVIFLASGIPKGQLDVLAVNLDVGDIVFENGGDVDLRRRKERTSQRGELKRPNGGTTCNSDSDPGSVCQSRRGAQTGSRGYLLCICAKRGQRRRSEGDGSKRLGGRR